MQKYLAKAILVSIVFCSAGNISTAADGLGIKLKSGRVLSGVVSKITKEGAMIKMAGNETLITWDKITDKSIYEIRLSKLGKKDGKGLFELGKYCLSKGFLVEAKSCFEKAAKVDPEVRAKIMEMEQKVQAKQLDKGLDIDFKNKDIFYVASKLARLTKTSVKIEPSLSKVIRKLPKSKQPKINYTANGMSLNQMLPAILAPLQMQYMSTPEGVVIFSRKLGLSPDTIANLSNIVRSGPTLGRINAAQTIALINAKEALPDVCEMAKHDDPDVRFAALQAANCFYSDQSYDALTSALKDPVIRIRMYALECLKRRVSNKTINLLVEIVKTDSCYEVAREAAITLSYIGTDEAAEAVQNCLRERKIREWDAKREMVRTMGKLGDTSAIPLLKKYLTDRDSGYRHRSAEALALIGDRTAVADIIAALEKNEKDWGTVAEFSRALAMLNTEESVNYIVNRINITENAGRKRHFIGCCRYMTPNKKAESALLNLIKNSKDKGVVYSCGSVMHIVGSEACIPVMIEAMEKYPRRYEIYNPLRMLTGQNLGWDIKKWKKWWTENKDKFKIKRSL